MSELITNSLRYDKNQKYVVIDFETSCLNLLSSSNKPWQVGITVAQNKKIVSSDSYLINWPDLVVSKDAARITGFDEDLVKREGINPKDGLDILDAYIYNDEYKILGYNFLNFDIYLHSIYRRLLDLPVNYSYINRCIDVRAFVMAEKLGIKLEDQKDLLFFQYKMLSYRQRGLKSNLAQACKDYGVEVDESRTHEATYDTILTYFVFLEMLKKFNVQ
jgi:DNA polymerase III epsilon subunit-like protein